MGIVLEMKEEENQSRNINNSKAASDSMAKGGCSWWWQNVKPFVNGGSAAVLAELQMLLFRSVFYNYGLSRNDREYVTKVLKWQPNVNFKKRLFLLPIQATEFALPMGSFEILTRKVIAANHGMPLGIHQEACCAVFAGIVGACIDPPIATALYHFRTKTKMVQQGQKLGYGDVYRALYRIGKSQGLSALWRPGVVWTSAAFYAGMLTPYNRSYQYFKVSCGFDEFHTQISAGAVSAFVASACCVPVRNVHFYMRAMKPNADGKFPFTSSLDCALKVLKARGLVGLYIGFPWFLSISSPITMMRWMALEAVRETMFYFSNLTCHFGLDMYTDEMDGVRSCPGLRGSSWIVELKRVSKEELLP